MIGRFHLFAQSALSSLGGADGASGSEASGEVVDERYELIKEVRWYLDVVKKRSIRGMPSTNHAKTEFYEELGNKMMSYSLAWPIVRLEKGFWQKVDSADKDGFYQRTVSVNESGRLQVESVEGDGSPGPVDSREYDWADVTVMLLSPKEGPGAMSTLELGWTLQSLKKLTA